MLPEESLLLACARAFRDKESVSQVGEAAAEVQNWDRFVRLAQRHRMTPLAYPALFEHAPKAAPDQIMDQLKGVFMANTIRNAFLIKELPRTLELFQKNGIRAIPFKGMVLAFSLYGDPNLRQVDDLDFMVHPDDLMKAKQLLVAAGYEPFPVLSRAEEKAYARAGWSHCMRSADGKYYIDLETRIVARQFCFHMPLELLWSNPKKLEMDGHAYTTLSMETLLLILCVHGTKHLWDRLVWVSDISAILRRKEEIDFARLVKTAAQCGGLRMLLVGLLIAQETSGEPLPPEIDEAVKKDPTAVELARATIPLIMVDPDASPRLTQEIGYHFAIRERLRDRLGFWILTMLTPTYSDWKSFTLPQFLFPLYYATRPFRLFAKFALRRGRT